MNPPTTLILTSVRNAEPRKPPQKIIIPIDIDLAELQEALGSAGFALIGEGEYVRLRRIPSSCVRKVRYFIRG
jgi:hypothetical protein